MPVANLTITFTVLLWIAVLSWPLARLLRLPTAPIQIGLGWAAALAVTGLGLDTGLRFTSFHDLVVYVLLPIAVFDAALQLDVSRQQRALLQALVIGALAVALTVALAGSLIYLGINHPTGFPLLAGLLAAALLAATDPAAVVSHLQTLGAPRRLIVLLESESLLNDALAVVVFAVIIALARNPDAAAGSASIARQLAVVLLGGVLTGLAGGAVARLCMTFSNAAGVRALLSVAAAYSSYLLAEWLLVSSVVAVLVTGLTLIAGAGRRAEVEGLWTPLGTLANGLIFVLAGATLSWSMFSERWLAMLIAIAALIAARALAVYGGALLLHRHLPLARRDQHVMFWGGTRGGITLALALMLPTELDYWWTIQSIAYGVVVFNLCVQLPVAGLMLRPQRLRTDA